MRLSRPRLPRLRLPGLRRPRLPAPRRPRPAGPHRFDALVPLALGAMAAIALSACAVPHQPTTARPSTAARPSTTARASTATLRPGSERVPAAAKAVTISMDIGMNQGGRKPPTPVTITDPARVHALVALINGLPPFPPGAYSCPADFGAGLTLTFRSGPGAPALAVATAELAGCDGVGLTIGGRSQPALAGPGTDSAPLMLKAAGLDWKIPSD